MQDQLLCGHFNAKRKGKLGKKSTIKYSKLRKIIHLFLVGTKNAFYIYL